MRLSDDSVTVTVFSLLKSQRDAASSRVFLPLIVYDIHRKLYGIYTDALFIFTLFLRTISPTKQQLESLKNLSETLSEN